MNLSTLKTPSGGPRNRGHFFAGFNLGLLMRQLTGYGTPKGAADAWTLVFIGLCKGNYWIWLVLVVHDDRPDQWMSIAVVRSWVD